MRLQIATGWRSLLLSSLLLSSSVEVAAKKDAPGVEVSEFKFVPWEVQYFDDSDVMVFEDRIARVVYRSDDAGEHWKPVDDVPAGELLELSMHPFDNKRAYIIGEGKTHWKTSDRGKSWEEFSTSSPASLFRQALTYHAGDPDRIIFNAMDCTGIFCEEITMYSTNGLKDTKFLRSDTDGCHWAKSSELFTTGNKDFDNDRIICVVRGRFSPWRKDYRLLISDDFFNKAGQDTQEFEPELEPGRTVQGIVNMAVVKKFLVVAASAEGTDEMALYVSDDSIKWHRAVFPHDHKLSEKAYTVLESTNYSIQIDVMNGRPGNPMGVFLSSNSNGTYFTRAVEHTNRNFEGYVDFEKVSGVQGIVLVNIVDNWEKVESSSAAKVVKTQISFDDGRTFQALKVGDKELHLHSVTELSNVGRVYSSPAPGLVMGVGNTGDALGKYKDGNLYVSDDAGETWIEGLKGPHKYEFGDQGSILVAIKDEDSIDEVRYSLNHGKDWGKVALEKDGKSLKVNPLELTTTKDSTSLKFLLEAIEPKVDNPVSYIIALDFDDMHEDKCKDSDMETWFARADKEGKGTCIMGHTQSYRRRKADADCFIKKEFEDPVPINTPCDCTDMDFECDVNYIRSVDRKECTLAPNAAFVIPEGACKKPDDKFEASSGWRLIPGNNCKRSSGAQKDDTVTKDCSGSVAPPASGDISHKQAPVPGSHFYRKIYLERTDASSGLNDGQEDETVIMHTDKGIWLSHDHGKLWKPILEDEDIVGIVPHSYFNDVVFFLTNSKKVFYSINRGDLIRSFDAPLPPTKARGLVTLSFHPKYKDWFIWTGDENCDSKGNNCNTLASYTDDRGDQWHTLRRQVGKCEYIKEPEHKLTKEEKEQRDRLIYCETRPDEDPKKPMQLVSSTDFFKTTPEVHLTNVVDFATMAEFIVVATRDPEGETLQASASVYGEQFAEAKFPHGFVVPHQQGYTVLDSSTHAVFLHVTTNNEPDREYGSIIKSNSNGTSYVMSLNAVDRDQVGYVDFEKMKGIEGVAMVNVVANHDSKNYQKEGKKLKSMITHNDGAEWDYLPPPAKDAEGKKFDCSGKLEKCSLNLHSYTERKDKSHTFYSSSAIGLLFGTGNVGEYLSDKEKADTFMTSDGGITWKSVKKGRYMWEFGDQGSIVVIVLDDKPTKEVYYSLDEGDTWTAYPFSDHEMRIQDITTVPSDNARNFLLWSKDDGKLNTINLDFTGLTDVPCKLDENNVEGGDYYIWQPKHPKQDNDCLFGHVSQYHRKKIASKCFNGRMIPHLHDIASNCSCTRQDFECDFNFERQTDGSCQLIKGYAPPDHLLSCTQNDLQEEWYEVTGYRRIPITTCQGGKELDVSVAHPCPGYEGKFGQRHGISGWTILFIILLCIGIASGAGYWVWKNWANKFGQIRLGEQSSFDGEAPYIKYPVIVLAGIVAIAQAIPLLISSLWRSASSAFGRNRATRFTTRDSFARGRGDYAVVDEDEGELLGDESDEEV